MTRIPIAEELDGGDDPNPDNRGTERQGGQIWACPILKAES